MPFYSARLHVVCIVDSKEYQLEGKYTCDYQFILFRANSFEHAFERALALGHEQETFYKNEDDKDVRWALNAVEQIYDNDEVDDDRSNSAYLQVGFSYGGNEVR